jgi:ATP-binding cassette subfamily F protein uup
MDALTADIRTLEKELADPSLYGRNQARYHQLVEQLGEATSQLEHSEARWLELEEKREQLAAARATG